MQGPLVSFASSATSKSAQAALSITTITDQHHGPMLGGLQCLPVRRGALRPSSWVRMKSEPSAFMAGVRMREEARTACCSGAAPPFSPSSPDPSSSTSSGGGTLGRFIPWKSVHGNDQHHALTQAPCRVRVGERMLQHEAFGEWPHSCPS